MKNSIIYWILGIVVIALILLGSRLYMVDSEYRNDDAEISFFVLNGISNELWFLIDDYENNMLTKEKLKHSYRYFNDYRGIISRNRLLSEPIEISGIVYHMYNFEEIDDYRIQQYKRLYNFIYSNLESLRDLDGDDGGNIKKLFLNKVFKAEFIKLIKAAND
jgi:hypothetical protein